TKATFYYLQKRTSKLIDFQLKIPENPIFVKLNPQLFSWTIENLVKNGIDAMKGKGKITISIETNSKYALVNVADTGKGLQKANSERFSLRAIPQKSVAGDLGFRLQSGLLKNITMGKFAF